MTQTLMTISKRSSLARTQQALAFVAICTGYFMTILDTTAVNVALPSIQSDLSVSVAGLQWIVDGYALVFASLLLTSGALGDRLGNRRIFLTGVAIFTVASALCGAGPNLGALQLARVVQGAGAALLLPASLALLSGIFPDGQQRARALGIWGGIAGIGAVMGPVVGGILVNSFGWRSIFFINLPIGVLGFALTLLAIDSDGSHGTRELDIAAQIAAIIALGTLTFACIESGMDGWRSPRILGASIIVALAATVFIAVERRARNPMLPLAFFSIPSFSAGNAVGCLLNFGFYGQLFIVSLFFQHIRHNTAAMTGLALLPEAVMALIGSTLAGRVTGRFGPRPAMLIGLAVGSAGFLAMTRVGAATPYVMMVPMLIAAGFGTAFTMPAMTAAVIAAAPNNRSGIASAVLNAARQVGSVIGVAVLGTLVGAGDFVAGMHVALGIAGGAFLCGIVLTHRSIRTGAETV